MNKKLPEGKQAIARKLPVAGNSDPWVMHHGRKVRCVLEREGWRFRSRTKYLNVDITTGTQSLPEAKRIARDRLASMPSEQVARGTLAQVSELYLAAPKRCGDETAKRNVYRLKNVAKDALGRTLEKVPLSELTDLWPRYVAAKQGRPAPDYSTRRAINRGINSAMKQASSVFMKALHPYYARHGVTMPPAASELMLAAEIPPVPAAADDAALVAAWRELRAVDFSLWMAIGLARFAGLRLSEIHACRGGWIEERGSAVYIRLKDREEENYRNKTGKEYLALVLDDDLADALRVADKESLVVPMARLSKWIELKPQQWARQFCPDTPKPLHRLRGLYADHVIRVTDDAIQARREALRAAADNLGHTNTATTEKHYATSVTAGTGP